MSDNWKLLDWEYVCDQSPQVQSHYEDVNFHSEDGLNYYEFIYTNNGLEKKVQEWWDSLTPVRKRELIAERIITLKNQLERLEAVEE